MLARSAPMRLDPDGERQARERFVEFFGVEKTFDGQSLVVKNLDLAIAKGEFLTLLGPSGSGKTTTLMMLAGFEAPTAGDIRIAGRSLSRVPPFRRNMGIVFQNYALFPHMTVRDNLSFPLSVRGLAGGEIKGRVDRALALVRLQGHRQRRPSELSGGQQQRVALARALIFDPDLVLMDEPLGALDKQLREQMQIEIKHIQRDIGVTVIYVTHDQSEALTMSDRIAVFNDGVVQQVASPEELYERPHNAFVAQFIGESNRFAGTIVDIDGAHCVAEIKSGLRISALAVNVESIGERCSLFVRPERVVLFPAAGDCENELDGRIEELIYHGDHTRVCLQVPGASEFLLKVSNVANGSELSPGQYVRIGWRRSDCRALDSD